MSKKSIGMICIIAGLVSAVLGIKAKNNEPANLEIIRNAVYVSDGKVLPENEGKVVIVTGILDAELPFVDEETGILLNTIVTYRHVEKLRIQENAEGGADYWEWDEVMDKASYGGTGKIIAPGVTLGEFAVSDEFIKTIPAAWNRTEYDKKELNQLGWNTFEDVRKVYLCQDERMPLEDEDITHYEEIGREEAYLDYVGTIRVTYDETDADNTMEYTIIGLQENGRLLEVEELDLKAICSGHLTVEELLAYAEESASSAATGSMVMALAFAVIGVLVLIRSGRKKS